MKDVISAQIKNNINIFLNRYFGAIAIFAAVIVLILGNLFLVWPKYKQITDDIRSAEKKESLNYSKRQKYLSQLKELKAEYKKINQDDIKKIEIMLPKTNNKEKLLAQIEKIILKNGFLLKDLRVEDVNDKQKKAVVAKKNMSADTSKGLIKPVGKVNIKKVKINMNVIGADYKGFKKLLGVIENNLRLMDITSLSFSPGGGSVSLEMYAYYVN